MIIKNCFNCKIGEPLIIGKVRCHIQNAIMDNYDGCDAFKYREEHYDDEEEV